jgi:hypothetical protein
MAEEEEEEVAWESEKASLRGSCQDHPLKRILISWPQVKTRRQVH